MLLLMNFLCPTGKENGLCYSHFMLVTRTLVYVTPLFHDSVKTVELSHSLSKYLATDLLV